MPYKQTCIRDIKLETETETVGSETETETVGSETETETVGTETETVGSETETETRHQVRDSSRQFKTSEMHIGPKSPNNFNFSQLLKSNTRVKSLKSADHLNCINYKEIKYFSHSEIF